MGGSSSNIFASSTSQELNNIYINETASCKATCNLSFNNNSVIIEGSSGNITIANVCKSDASCLMQQQINTKLINSIVQKTSQTDTETTGPNSLPGLILGADLSDVIGSSTNETIIQNALISNNITQSISSSCEGHTNVNANNNLIVVKDFTGNVNLTNQGSASANCNMTNLASLSVRNSTDQAASQKITKIGLFALIVIGLCVVGAVIAIVSICAKHKHTRHQTGQTSSASQLQDDNDVQRNLQSSETETETPTEDTE